MAILLGKGQTLSFVLYFLFRVVFSSPPSVWVGISNIILSIPVPSIPTSEVYLYNNLKTLKRFSRVYLFVLDESLTS